MPTLTRILFLMSFCTLLIGQAVAASPEYDESHAINPLRLSYINGNVSFSRYGAPDWVAARVNTPIAAGDSIYTADHSELELQTESRSYIRADDNTQLTVVNQTQDFLQLKITSGLISLDLRSVPTAGYSIEIDTPNAVFMIDRLGYYRVEVDGDVHFITRRGGRATAIFASGRSILVQPSEQVVLHGTDIASTETYIAPEQDDWDRWNYERTNFLADALSERYLPPGVAGARDLDLYGNWRVTPEYGAVWVPENLAPDWVPYSAGQWVWDPFYQWTWVDDAPWGWAPFHYGRWVNLRGYWGWCPGPVAFSRPVYAPALVAFFGVTRNFYIGFSGPGVSWVALGWGEPVLTWWGRPGYLGRPWWGGWSGPRVVNNVVIRNTTVVNVTNITYSNSRIPNTVLATSYEQFGGRRNPAGIVRLHGQEQGLERIRGELPVKPSAASLVADSPKGIRPPDRLMARQVVTSHQVPQNSLPWKLKPERPMEQQYIPAPKPDPIDTHRSEYGTGTGPERARPAPLPPYDEWRRNSSRQVMPDGERQPLAITGNAAPKPARATPGEAGPARSRMQEPVAPRETPAPVQERSPIQRRDAPPPSQPIPIERSLPPRPEHEPANDSKPSVRSIPSDQRMQASQGEASPQPMELPGKPANRIYSDYPSGGKDRAQQHH